MDGQYQQVPRATATAAAPAEAKSAFVIQRNSLTLFFSVAALVVACVSALVNLFIFMDAGKQKLVNEADQINLQAEANRILKEINVNPGSHQVLSEELTKLYENLNYRPPRSVQLSDFERAAFALLVEQYALPLREVQLKRAEVLVRRGTPTLWGLLSENLCEIDPTSCAQPQTIQAQTVK